MSGSDARGSGELQSPPWDWSPYDREMWLNELEELGKWVDWLQQAYRVVELPRCWPAHEGLRLELVAVREWWLDLYAHRGPDEPRIPVEAVTRWHATLRSAATDWRERYANCRHTGSDVDQEKKPLAQLASARQQWSEAAYDAQVVGRRT